MSIYFFKQLILVLFGAVEAIIAILALFSDKEKRPKLFKLIIFLCIIVIILYVAIGIYTEIINRNQIFADLVIYIGEPYLVNVNGTETDGFIKNANYNVVNYSNGFSLNATIKLTNIYTRETMVYNTSRIGEGYRIENISSGEYDIEIITDEYQPYSERIVLDSTNIGWEGSKNIWDFTAFMFEDFYDYACCFTISIGDIRQEIEYPAFGVYADAPSIYVIFSSEIDWSNNGTLAGEFWGYRDVYTVVNSISTARMEPVIIDVTNG